jgi:hypothetical protein
MGLHGRNIPVINNKILVAKVVPLSVSITFLLPAVFILSTANSHRFTAYKLSFLYIHNFPVFAAATSRSVWRQRKAGICNTST